LSAITAHQLAGHVMAAMRDNVRSYMTPATA
jgi:D-amino-acid dehydrogenase